MSLMKGLEHIKKLENEVSRKIEAARSNAEKKVSGMVRDREKLIEDRLGPVKLRLARDIEKNKVDAEAEAAKILRTSDVKIREIQEGAEKNFQKAVKTILGFLTYDKF
jgi:vacuolar-type H+-ATPase subunit H